MTAKFGIFDDGELDNNVDMMIATTTGYLKLQNRQPKRLYCHFRLSVVVAIVQVSEAWPKRQNRRWNCHHICHSSRNISISGFAPQCHFRLSDIVTITWGTVYSDSPLSKISTLSFVVNSGITISGFGGHIVISGFLRRGHLSTLSAGEGLPSTL